MNDNVNDKNGVTPELHQMLFQSAIKVTKLSNELPNTGTDWDYYQSFPAYAQAMKHFGSRITSLMTKIYGHYGLTARIGRMDLEEQIELVSDSNDVLMERINLSLDEAAGLKKQAETVVVEMMAKTTNINGSWNRHSVGSSAAPYRLLSAKNIMRPQLKFKDKIRNKAAPFVPKIKEKPHSLKPLAILVELNDFGDEEFSHPYEFELERFVPDSKFLTVNEEVVPYRELQETSLVMVETEENLKSLIEDLSKESVIAVDLEAHSYRSFQGITCLMQISTEKKDYIVDTLELWDHLQNLNEIFCNPNIVKIFHGADSDVQWLQRDFGIYIVNLFDTYHAAKLLGFAQLSLAFLLRHYCNVIANKQYQLADWRIRPLPEEMIKYAREDTHYLGYIYEKLKQDLKAKGTGDNLLMAVWNNSRLVCLKRYRIPPMTAESHLEMYRLSKKVFNERQLYALKELFAWRDRVAREEDESTGFVLPKHMMLQIADVLPREMQGILACCSPIPTLVRQHLLHLHEIIMKAREMPLSTLQRHGQPLAVPKLISAEHDTEDPLHCVHDLTQDIRDDLPTLLTTDGTVQSLNSEPMDEGESIHVNTKSQPEVRVFAETTEDDTVRKLVTDFVSPYTRYMRVRAQMSAEEAAEAARVEKLRQYYLDTVAQCGSDGNQEVVAAEDDEKIEQPAVPRQKKKLSMAQQGAKKVRRVKGSGKTTDAKKSSSEKPKNPKLPSETTTVEEKPSTSQSPGTKRKDEVDSTVEMASTSSTKKPSPAKKIRTDNRKRTASNFEPFDYSQVDYQAFKRSALRDDAGGRGRGRNRRGGSRSYNNNKIHRKSGSKSLTYSSK